MERSVQIVVELLTKGITQAEVARITENSPSAISQVATTYRAKIESGKTDVVIATNSHGTHLDRLEILAATKLESVLELETDSMKIAKIFQTLNSAVRRDSGETGGSGGNTTNNIVAVKLDVPAHLRQPVEVVTNTHNDVVAVDGRDLTPASMRHINKLAGIAEGTAHEVQVTNQAHDEVLASQVFIPGLDRSPEF